MQTSDKAVTYKNPPKIPVATFLHVFIQHCKENSFFGALKLINLRALS